MIATLKGKITFKSYNKIELEIQNIGWEIYLPQRYLSKLKLNQTTFLYIYHHITEKTANLYGFLTRKDKQVFEMLLSVSGIGPKIAMEISSQASGEHILKAITQADVDFFNQIKGLGKKGAQRIIVDLKTKVGSLKELELKKDTSLSTIYDGLLSLGFKKQEVTKVIKKLPKKLLTDEERLKFALKKLGK